MVEVDWVSQVITIPQSFLTPLVDCFGLNLNDLHIALRNLEATEEAAPFPITHNHVEVASPGTVVPIEVVEIINGYQVEFTPAGTYEVCIEGASNIGNNMVANGVGLFVEPLDCPEPVISSGREYFKVLIDNDDAADCEPYGPGQFAIKEGDTLPELNVILVKANDYPLNLQQATSVDIRFRYDDGTVFTRSGIITDGLNGKVGYTFAPGETDVPGTILIEYIVNMVSGVLTVPSTGYFGVIVSESLA